MRFASLSVERTTVSESREFRFEAEDPKISASEVGAAPGGWESFSSRLKELEGSTAAQGNRLESFLRESAERLAGQVPSPVLSNLREWASAGAGESVLRVVGAQTARWELLTAVVPNLFVTRSPEKGTTVKTPWPAGPDGRLLVVGWPALLGLVLPGIQKELSELGRYLSGSGVRVVTSASPSFEDLERAIAEVKPTVVHLSPPVVDDQLPRRLPMGPEGGVAQWIELKRVINVLRADDALRLVTLNACYGLDACREICESLNVAVVGWAGNVQDRLATELTFSLYDELFRRRRSLSEAVSRFCRALGTDQLVTRGMPTVWAAGTKQLESPLFGTAPPLPVVVAATEPRRASTGRVTRSAPPPAPASTDVPAAKVDEDRTPATPRRADRPRVQIELTLPKALFPSLIRNGLPVVEQLTLDSGQEAELELELEVECDTGAGRSEYRSTVELEGRKTLLDAKSELRFPVLYELMDSEERRHVSFSVAVRHQGLVIARKTQSVPWRGRSEWLDTREAWPYVASFVVPMSAGVQKVVEEARRILRALAGPRATFNGYGGGPREVDRQADAVFQAMRDPPLALRYITPPGLPLYAPAAPATTTASIETGSAPPRPAGLRAAGAAGQMVRLPDVVVDQRQGTCHDLTLLFCAVLEYLNLFPLVILIEGHTFAGYWRSHSAHEDSWRANPSERTSTGRWTLTRRQVEDLQAEEKVQLVESTRVSESATFAAACQEGGHVFAKTADPKRDGRLRWDVAVDIAASRQHLIEPV